LGVLDDKISPQKQLAGHFDSLSGTFCSIESCETTSFESSCLLVLQPMDISDLATFFETIFERFLVDLERKIRDENTS